MTTTIRHDLLHDLEVLCEIHRETRLGQLFCNLASLIDLDPGAAWTVDEADLTAEAEVYLESQLRRLGLGGPPSPPENQRAGLIRALGALRDRHPGWTVGRLLDDVVTPDRTAATTADRAAALWDIEDPELLRRIRRRLDDSASRDTPLPPAAPCIDPTPHSPA